MAATAASVMIAAMANKVGKGSDVEFGSGEGVGVSEGKGNKDGSKEVEIGLESGDWSTPLTAYPR